MTGGLEKDTSHQSTGTTRKIQDVITYKDGQVLAAYADGLPKEADQSGPVVSLDQIPPDDKEQRLQQLRAKLDEYSERLVTAYREQSPHVAPELLNPGLRYKRAALKIALDTGSVHTFALSRAFMRVDGYLSSAQFDNAVGVIEDYLQTGGKLNIQGKLPSGRT